MEFHERGDSQCESIGWGGANVGGELSVADDQIHSDCDSGGGATSLRIGHSDGHHSTCQSKSTIEVLHSDSHVRKEATSQRTTSASSGCKAKQRLECVLGISGEMTGGHSSQVVEKERTTPLEAFPNAGEGGGDFRSSAGEGELFHEEELPMRSTGIDRNVPARPGQGEDLEDGDVCSGWHIPNITRSKSAPVERTNGGQKLPSNVLEVAVRLSESLGMAVATVFHEVFERNGSFRPAASPVDELSGLLEAALKESLFRVLGNERAIFVENFRNSFRSTYQTMRSVSRAYAKSWDKLSSSKQRHPNSWRASQSKSRRISPSPSYRERSRKVLDETFNLDKRKHPAAGNRQPNYSVKSLSEDGTTSFHPQRYSQHGKRLYSQSGSPKSCVDESLQSAFFSNITREPEGHSDTAASCSKTCLNESLESDFFTSSNPERGDQDGSTKSCSMNSANESMGSLPPVPTPDARDVQSELLYSDDSWDVNMFSAASSPESDEFGIVDRDVVSRSAHGKNDRGLAVTFDSWTPKLDHKHSRRVVQYEAYPSSLRSVVDSMQHTKSESPGRSLRADSTQHTKPVGSFDSLGRRVVGDSMQVTKVMGISDSPSSRNPNSLNPGPLPKSVRNSSDRVPAHSSSDHPGDLPIEAHSPQGRTFGANSEVEESWRAAEGPRTNLEHNLSGGASLFRRPQLPEPASYENVLVHTRLVWGDETQLAAPPLEESVVPPFLNYGVRANTRQTLLERYVEAQETQNHLKQLELAHSMKHLLVKKDHLQLQSESNVLMRENVDLGRSKIELKEFELEDGKLTAAHRDLSRTCADELVAGLCVMLLALAYGAWKFSYTRLSRVVTMCQLPPREPRHGGWLGTNWMANAMDAISWQMQALTCEVTKAGRMLAGLILIAFITSSLLRRSVTSSSQTMPATIIIVVLAGICGFAGKISIDSLGGDGYLWLLFWETLCFLHAFATTCTPWLYKYLYGPSSKFYQSGASSWMKFCSICARFSFHTFLAFVLPTMAGLLPFASLNDLNAAFWEFWEADTIIGPY
ncbi:unnamed protein product [Calypogeia fissa]